MLRRVEIGELIVSSNPEDTLISYALGSCLGVAIHDPVAGIGGLIHSKVPVARMCRPEPDAGPAICADQGTMALLQQMYDAGAQKGRMVVSIAGCASPVKAITQDIGKRNHAIARKLLWKNGIFVHAEDIGGDQARTILLNIGNGNVLIKTGGETVQLG